MQQVISLSFYPCNFIHWRILIAFMLLFVYFNVAGKIYGCIPLEWSRSGSVIYDHSDYGTSNKPMNPFPGWICQFLRCTDATNNNIKRNGNCWTQHHFLRKSTVVSSKSQDYIHMLLISLTYYFITTIFDWHAKNGLCDKSWSLVNLHTT